MLRQDRRQGPARTCPEPARMAELLHSCGLDLTRLQLHQLWKYHGLLRQGNLELNLTRIHNFTNMVLKLYVDSILPGQLMNLPSPLLDLGSGPGMPGVPLKIAYPHLRISLAESRQKRVAFLEKVRQELALEDLEIIGEKITAAFETPMAAVITRALEGMALTLERIAGCLARDGLAIFMKGPNCDVEITEVLARYARDYRMLQDHRYEIPGTSHLRRLVVFQRVSEPPCIKKERAMKRHVVRRIDSEKNELFRDLKKLLSSRGIKKQQRALVSGPKQVADILEQKPDLCEAWISAGEGFPPPSRAAADLAWYQLEGHLFGEIDVFGTGTPLLLVRIPPIPEWEPQDGLPEGCTLFIPFQDPENVGAAIRSAVAFGAAQVILLAESAHPCHPKALRASGGAVLSAQLLAGPPLQELPEHLPLMALAVDGEDLSRVVFPGSFGLLAGMEGPGLPEPWKRRTVAIPISRHVESLNAATAAAIALYVWSQATRGTQPGIHEDKTNATNPESGK